MGSKSNPNTCTKRRLTNNSAAIKNGNKAGKTVEYHNWNPKDAAATVSRGFINIKTINIRITAVKK